MPHDGRSVVTTRTCSPALQVAASATLKEMGASSHYVYIYRDPDTRAIRYVGKGTGDRVDKVVRDIFDQKDAEKIAERVAKQDKQAVAQWFRRLAGKRIAPAVDIMECADEEQALAIEAGLISALWGEPGLLNAVHGHHREFVPLGLPTALSRSQYKSPLTRDEVASLGGALVVYVSAASFFGSDGRKGAAPRRHMNPADVHARIRAWWQVGKQVQQWAANPADAPTLLIGMTGPPRQRWVWGSVRLDRRGWSNLTPDGGLYQLPTRSSSPVTDRDVNAGQLRGRRTGYGEFGPMTTKTGARRFGSWTSQFFDVVEH